MDHTGECYRWPFIPLNEISVFFFFFKLLFGRTRSVDYILTYIGGPTARSAAPRPAGFCFEKRFSKEKFFCLSCCDVTVSWHFFLFKYIWMPQRSIVLLLLARSCHPFRKGRDVHPRVTVKLSAQSDSTLFVWFWSSQRFFSIWIFGGVVVVESSVILLFPLRIMGENYFTRKFQQQQQQANEPAGKCPDTHGE